MSALADAIDNWAVNNSLQLNNSKTKTIVFGSVPYIGKLSSIARTHIEIGGVIVQFESFVRNFEMILDSTLSWKEQVDQVCRKVNSIMHRSNFFRRSKTAPTSTAVLWLCPMLAMNRGKGYKD